MDRLIGEPVAATMVVLDASGGATLTGVARAIGKPISTVQRAVDGLVRKGVLIRESPRGRLMFRPNAPRRALSDLAAWSLGRERVAQLRSAATRLGESPAATAPRTIKNEDIRKAWPQAIGAIVETYQPARVILFGSQARGNAREGSDVDLLVVFDEVDDRRERRIGIRRLLRDMPFSKDVLVASTQDVANPWPGSAIAEAMHDGMTVYER